MLDTAILDLEDAQRLIGAVDRLVVAHMRRCNRDLAIAGAVCTEVSTVSLSTTPSSVMFGLQAMKLSMSDLPKIQRTCSQKYGTGSHPRAAGMASAACASQTGSSIAPDILARASSRDAKPCLCMRSGVI